MLKVYEALPEGSVLVGAPVCYRVLLKEGQAAVKAYFLSGIDAQALA